MYDSSLTPRCMFQTSCNFQHFELCFAAAYLMKLNPNSHITQISFYKLYWSYVKTGFRVHTRFLQGWHAGLTCRGSWVEDQGEGDKSFSRGVRMKGAPANTDDFWRVWHTHTVSHTDTYTNTHTGDHSMQRWNHKVMSRHDWSSHNLRTFKWILWYFLKSDCLLRSASVSSLCGPELAERLSRPWLP